MSKGCEQGTGIEDVVKVGVGTQSVQGHPLEQNGQGFRVDEKYMRLS